MRLHQLIAVKSPENIKYKNTLDCNQSNVYSMCINHWHYNNSTAAAAAATTAKIQDTSLTQAAL